MKQKITILSILSILILICTLLSIGYFFYLEEQKANEEENIHISPLPDYLK